MQQNISLPFLPLLVSQLIEIWTCQTNRKVQRCHCVGASITPEATVLKKTSLSQSLPSFCALQLPRPAWLVFHLVAICFGSFQFRT